MYSFRPSRTLIGSLYSTRWLLFLARQAVGESVTTRGRPALRIAAEIDTHDWCERVDVEACLRENVSRETAGVKVPAY